MFEVKEFPPPTHHKRSGAWFAGAVVTNGATEQFIQFKFQTEPTKEEVMTLVEPSLILLNTPDPVSDDGLL